MQTRQKFKEAFDIHFASTIERAEKQIILAKQARRMINLLDDTPIVPGDSHPAFEGTEAGRQILNDAEDELRAWQPDLEPVHTTAGSLGAGAMPGAAAGAGPGSRYGSEAGENSPYADRAPRSRSGSGGRARVASGESMGSNEGGEVRPPYPMTEAEKRQVEEAGVI